MKLINLFKYIPVFLRLKHDQDLAFNLVTKLAGRVLPEYRFTWPNLTWWKNAEFNEYLKLFDEDKGFNTHRRWALNQLIRLTADIQGDTAECGVYKGCSSYAILQSNKHSKIKRWHHVFDSFEGLSLPSDKDNDYWTPGDLSISEKIVEKNLAEFDGVTLYKGWIPSRFNEVSDRQFSFVHVDVDLYQPTFDSLAFFYDRLAKGAIFLCDDYGFDSCVGATTAIDDFLKSKPEKMIALPDGGGFFIKNCTTAEK
ncbi:MAG: TylF/MycF/NovP-related O-methyltransferase [Methylococcaceae bacterium]|nr:TylF/MycF/NovP-related O-methyltransferase [Methylococcaceae bacterium]MDP3904958.1 TylF/MycF/NovP-related O-methyltransferase [Methylococcaceae bacterium]